MKKSVLAMVLLGLFFSISSMASQKCLDEATQTVKKINPDINRSFTDYDTAQTYAFSYEKNYCFIEVDVPYSVENGVCVIGTPIFHNDQAVCP